MIHVISSGFFTTIQDAGRKGYRRFGVPVSGPMDWYACSAANLLAGNHPGAACLEIGMLGCIVQVEDDHLMAAAGNGHDLYLDSVRIPFWMSFYARKGQKVEVVNHDEGGWVYLAVHGGIKTQPVLNSQSTYVRGKLGGLKGEAIKDGDYLPTGPDCYSNPYDLAGRKLKQEVQLRYLNNPELRVISGPQIDKLTSESKTAFFQARYMVTWQSDRMGYRLSGEKLSFIQAGDILSEGMVPGTIQVPPDGQPIVMMSDSPTSGGYSKIAAVITADLPIIAQIFPGVSQVGFRQVSVEEAQETLREMWSRLTGELTGNAT